MAISHKPKILSFLYVVLVIFNLDTGGASTENCTTGDLKLAQTETGDIIDNKPVFLVEVYNDCSCTQTNATLFCHGFQTVEKFPPEMSKIGDNCVLKDELRGSEEIRFSYAWDTEFPFSIVSSNLTTTCYNITQTLK